MQIIKVITKGDWTLEHSWIIDDFGLKKNLMQISRIDENGINMIYPLFPPMRTTPFPKGEVFLGDDISEFSEEEYQNIISDFILKLNNK